MGIQALSFMFVLFGSAPPCHPVTGHCERDWAQVGGRRAVRLRWHDAAQTPLPRRLAVAALVVAAFWGEG